jgi:hypothetical protein
VSRAAKVTAAFPRTALPSPFAFRLFEATVHLPAFRVSNISLIYALEAVKRNPATPDVGPLPLGIVGGLLFIESRPSR